MKILHVVLNVFQKRILNTVKHLRWNLLVENIFRPLIIFVKTSILDV